MVTFRRGMQFVAITLAATMVLTGCIPGDDPGVASADGKFELYLGPIPAPAELPAAAAPLEIPTPPTDYNDDAAMDEYMKAIEKYSEETMKGAGGVMDQSIAIHELVATARKGGEQAVAAWQTLLVTAGLAVASPDGEVIEVNGQTGAGFPITDPELRLHSALSGTSGGISIMELARAIAPEADEGELAQAILDDLTSSSNTPFGMVIHAVGPEMLLDRTRAKPLEEVVLRWDQAGLLLRRISAELVSRGVSEAMPRASAGPSSMITTMTNVSTMAGQPTTVRTAAEGKKACDLSTDPHGAKTLEYAGKVSSEGFGFTLDTLSDGGYAPGGFAKAVLAMAAIISTIATYIVKVALIKAEFTLKNSPLLRTKTNRPGEIRDLIITVSFDEGAWADARRCLNLFSSFAGVSIPTFDAGPADKIGIDLSTANSGILRVGDGAGGSKSVNKGITNKQGEAQFKLSGAPYREKIPEKASPNDITVQVTAESNVEGNDFMKDIESLLGSLVGIGAGTAISVALTAISRMRIISHNAEIPVRDWVISGNFEVTVAGTINTRSAWNFNTGGCGSYQGTTITGSVESRSTLKEVEPVKVTAALISDENYYADQAIVLMPMATEFFPIKKDDGYSLFDMRGNYTTTKTYTEPETQGLPPLYVHPRSPDCAGGGGEYEEPASDCGARSYEDGLDVKQVTATRLLVDGSYAGVGGHLWKNCGSPLYPNDSPVATDDCRGSTERTGGQLPTVTDIYDASKTKLIIEGSVLCTYDGPGNHDEMIYDWTLTLCRLDDEGKVIAKC